METVSTVSALKNAISKLSAKAKEATKTHNIGFVPTMGALHMGHLSLVSESQKVANYTVVSIFVNPLQFTNQEDLTKYPRTLDEDKTLLEDAGVDILFCPTVADMYPTPSVATFSFGLLESVMEGASRPGHFNGVGVVVSKLFSMVMPDVAFFGQKDYQQLAIIKALTATLSFQIQIVGVPTLRNESGLALSSRNQRLSPSGLILAQNIFKCLKIAAENLRHLSVEAAIDSALAYLKTSPAFTIDYLVIANQDTLQPYGNAHRITTENTVICIACILEGIRLIDNLEVSNN